MAQKSIPIFNKVGYSMFWNSMWDNKNNFSKKIQKENFIKLFINFFISDFFYNKFVYFYNFKKINFFNLNLKYKLNNLFKSNLLYKNLINYSNNDLLVSKVWVLKFQNWIVIYFLLYSKNNFLLNFNDANYKGNNYYSIINNYYLNFFKFKINKTCLKKAIFLKNNF